MEMIGIRVAMTLVRRETDKDDPRLNEEVDGQFVQRLLENALINEGYVVEVGEVQFDGEMKMRALLNELEVETSVGIAGALSEKYAAKPYVGPYTPVRFDESLGAYVPELKVPEDGDDDEDGPVCRSDVYSDLCSCSSCQTAWAEGNVF